MSTSAKYLPEVKEQYEDLPYPPRDPNDEKKRLVKTSLDLLEHINHFGFKGRETFKNGFRCLVAGGGTGDSTIHLAEQLKNIPNAEIIQIDLSQASLNICKERAKVRELTNIEWKQGSLLDVANLDIGKFDYINCSGVLHHLDSPKDGLNALKSVLTEDGIIGVMVYAPYGRISVYPMQEALRYVNHDTDDKQEKLQNAKNILDNLPKEHFVNGNNLIQAEQQLFGDSGLYDILLHSQDRSYTVSQLYNWVEGCDLNIIRLYDELKKDRGYNPKYYIKDENIAKKVAELSLKEQQSLAEILNGSLYKHLLYVGKKSASDHIASIKNKNLVPFFLGADKGANLLVAKNMEQNLSQKMMVINQKSLQTILPATKEGIEIIKCIDGQNSIEQILKRSEKKLRKSGIKSSSDMIEHIFADIYTRLNETENMFLRSKDVGDLR